MSQQHIILGRDRTDAEVQRDQWLAEHPELKIVRVHSPTPEPPTWLTPPLTRI